MVMRRPASVRRVLVVDPDPATAARAVDALRAAAVEALAVPDADTGLRTLAAHEPDVLVLDLELPKQGGPWLLKRLRDDFMGARPRIVVTTCAEGITGGMNDLGVDAVVLKPATPATLVAATSAHADPLDTPQREQERLRELVSLSVLSGEMDAAVANLAKRVGLVFRCSECVVVAVVGDRQWIGSARGEPPREDDTTTWELARVALDAGAPILVPTAEGGVASYLAVPLDAPGGTSLGVILLVDDYPRSYAVQTIDGLRALGTRLHAELAWRSVHERIAADRDRLRESSMLDPMLAGVWTRVAFDQALPGEVAACQRRKEPLTLAVIDVRGMRHINERYGHVVGDAALKHVSYLVRQTLRSQDLVARYGGDALACALLGAPAVDTRRVIERIQAIVHESPLDAEGTVVRLAITAGLAPLLGEDDTGEAALSRAAAALRAAKRRGEPILIADAAFLDEGEASIPTEGLSPGTTLGGMYQILHEISRGAMGVVYRAEDLGLGRPVALKTLRPDLARDRNFVERFRIEAATLANLRHENLVQVYAFGESSESVYFVMELVEGEPLDDRIELAAHEGRFMSFEETAHVIAQIASALDAMHKAGVLHRDVKPSNILLDRVRERAVLVDVGIAKRRGSATDPAGTPGFTAPESFHGGSEGSATDVYGLAATAYMLLSTAPPFGVGPGEEVIQRQTRQAPVPPSSYRIGISDAVDRLLVTSLDPDPAQRPASACEFARALAAALTPADVEITQPIVLPGTRPPVERASPQAGTKLVRGGAGSEDDDRDTQRPVGAPPRHDPALDAPSVAHTPPGEPHTASFQAHTPPGEPHTAASAAHEALEASSAPHAPLDVAHTSPFPPHRPLAAAPTPSAAAPTPSAAAPTPPAPPRGQRISGPRAAVRAPVVTPPPMPAVPMPSLREPDLPAAGVPHTRGVLFRSAYRVLGARQSAAWVGQVARRNPALGQALQPQNTLLSWHPTRIFEQLLAEIEASGRDPLAFARQLGHVATAVTFSRFLGADPAALSPWEVLASADLFWRRYHTWGFLGVERTAESEAHLTIAHGPRNPHVCASTLGILEQVATLSGAAQARVAEAECEASGSPACRFVIVWAGGRH